MTGKEKKQLAAGLLKGAALLAILLILPGYPVSFVYAALALAVVLNSTVWNNGLEEWAVRTAATAAILLFPLRYPPHHLLLTYILIIILIAGGLFLRLRNGDSEHERFVREWDLERLKGFWRHMLKQGLFFLFIFVAALMAIQFLYYDYNPLEIVQGLAGSGRQAFIFLLIILGFGCLTGAVSWFEKENRYYKM